MITFNNIFDSVYVSNDVKQRSKDIYSDVCLTGDDIRVASVILASVVESEPVHITEYTNEFNISTERIRSKMNIITATYE